MTLSHLQGYSLLQAFQMRLLPARCYVRAVFAVIACPSVRLSVCLSVCLSQVGVVPKRLNPGTRNQRHKISRNCSYMTQKIFTSFRWDHPTPSGGAKCRYGR